MKRLTKTYADGTHGVADNLPCGENSYAFKDLLIHTLGEYEDLGITPDQVRQMDAEFARASKELAEYRKAEMQPTAGSWHRVADGDLPKHANRVLVYIKYKASDRIPPHGVANYAGGKWWYPSDREITGEAQVIAWMELPEYEEEQP